MKTRSGFVSNSSSSSFVVAFPRKPKSFADVYEMMFDSKEGGIQVYDRDGMSHVQVAERVWRDVQDEKPLKVTKVADVIANRYHYYSSTSCVTICGSSYDDLGGQWAGKGHGDKYYGVDEKTLNAYRDYIMERERRREEIQDEQRKIVAEWMAKKGLVEVPFAYEGGTKYKTDEPYTEEEIEAYNKWIKKLETFKNRSKRYKALKDELWSECGWEKDSKMRMKVARQDAKAFMADNEGAHIVVLSYADDTAEGTTMEHGNIFKNVPHITISNH